LGYLANNTADTVCLFYQRTEIRAQHFNFSYPIINVSQLCFGILQLFLGSSKLCGSHKTELFSLEYLECGKLVECSRMFFIFSLININDLCYKNLRVSEILNN
jgi:hypothetical protein